MCSRYYIELGMMDEISRVVQNIDGRIWLAQGDMSHRSLDSQNIDWNLVCSDGDIPCQ